MDLEENLLHKCEILQKRKSNLEIKLHNLKTENYIQASRLEEHIKTGRKGNPTENAALKINEVEENLFKCKKALLNIMFKIIEALEGCKDFKANEVIVELYLNNLTTEEAAKKLNCSTMTIYRNRQKGLKYFKEYESRRKEENSSM